MLTERPDRRDAVGIPGRELMERGAGRTAAVVTGSDPSETRKMAGFAPERTLGDRVGALLRSVPGLPREALAAWRALPPRVRTSVTIALWIAFLIAIAIVNGGNANEEGSSGA